MKTKIALMGILFCSALFAQEIYVNENSGQWKKHYWISRWICHPTASPHDYGVYHFRKTFALKDKPDAFVIHLSGDNRYRLFVNGAPVCFGPARGDLTHWRYDTVDIAPFLKEGGNVLAAWLANFGENRPAAQISHRSQFILQAEKVEHYFVNTGNNGWKVIQNHAYAPLLYRPDPGGEYTAGPTDKVMGDHYPWNWEQIDHDEDAWLTPKTLKSGCGRGVMFGGPPFLVKRTIPFLEEKREWIEQVRRVEGMEGEIYFLPGSGSLHIPARKKVTLLLDQTYLTMGYPELRVSRGKGGRISLRYGEALYSYIEEEKRVDPLKGNRNDLEGKVMRGVHDEFYPDGGAHRLFRPLWFRCYRFIEMEIETADDPLEIVDFYNIRTTYPLHKSARFESDYPYGDRIVEAGWRTCRLCAMETYVDCPYFEQLNYAGDTRIQILISLSMCHDDRLARDAIRLFEESRLPEGLTRATYPSSNPMVIVGYSLFHISMIHDYMMYRGDEAWLEQFLPGIRCTLDWFERRLDTNGMVAPLEWWQFTDWTPEWFGGIPEGADREHSAIMSLQYVYALQKAIAVYEHFGFHDETEKWKEQVRQVNRAVYENCYVPSRMMFAESPAKNRFSRHTNLFAILTDAAPADQQRGLMDRLLIDLNLPPVSYYFSFYKFEAMKKTGLGDRYLSQLKPWEKMIDQGLTTFAEHEDPARSECHAWSASPLYFNMKIVGGIEPLKPGFREVRIAPALGLSSHVKAAMPVPQGMIELDLAKEGEKGIKGVITLPENLKGEFKWQGRTLPLSGGINTIDLR